MVTAVTNLGRSGLYDWLVQRVSAAILAAYTFFIVGFILMQPEVTYSVWHELFQHFWMRLFSLITLLSIASHAWIGMWAVLTDYITPMTMGGKATFVRVTIQLIIIALAVTYTVWGIEILWGM